MPQWRCPHCQTPQPETSRCWVCKRSSTSCATCRHFRRSIAGQIGYCGLDSRRRPLAGDEMRGCWEERRDAPAPVPSEIALEGPACPPPGRRLDFIPIDGQARVEVAPLSVFGDATAATGRAGLWPDE